VLAAAQWAAEFDRLRRLLHQSKRSRHRHTRIIILHQKARYCPIAYRSDIAQRFPPRTSSNVGNPLVRRHGIAATTRFIALWHLDCTPAPSRVLHPFWSCGTWSGRKMIL
jgi:hypothetical protein